MRITCDFTGLTYLGHMDSDLRELRYVMADAPLIEEFSGTARQV
jgi:hypothetical protein